MAFRDDTAGDGGRQDMTLGGGPQSGGVAAGWLAAIGRSFSLVRRARETAARDPLDASVSSWRMVWRPPAARGEGLTRLDSDTRYGTAWYDSADMLFALRVQPGRLVFDAVNRAFETATGLAAVDVAGRTPDQTLPLSVAGVLAERCVECLSEGRAIRYIDAVPLPSGRTHWEVTLAPSRLRVGDAGLVLGSAREVSAGVEAQIALGEGRRAVPAPAVATIHFTAFPDGRPDQVSASFFAYTGLDRAAGVDEILATVQPEDVAAITPSLDETPADGVYEVDVRIRRQDGAYRWFRLRAELVEGLAGLRWYGMGADIHEQREPPDAAAGGAVETLRGLAEARTTEMVFLDRHGRIVSANGAWRASWLAVTGEVGGALGGRYVEACGRMLPELDGAALKRGLAELAAGRAESFSRAYPVRTRGAVHWRQVRITPLSGRRSAAFVATHEDLTEIARARAALRETAGQLLSAQEEERQRIAIELHDSTAQHLVALGLGVSRLRRLLGGADGAREVLEDMARSAQEAVTELRVLSYLMRPPALTRDGLEATARRFVKGFGVRTGLTVGFHAEGAFMALHPAVQHTAFRVLQEALSNVYRHAEASGVEVGMVFRKGLLTVRVADDGRGIQGVRPGDLEGAPLGVGVAGMRMRVEQLGGELSIGGAARGTTVTARIPQHPAPDPARRPAGLSATPQSSGLNA